MPYCIVIASGLLRTLLPSPQQVNVPVSTPKTSIEMWARPRTASSRGHIAGPGCGAFYRTLLFLFTIHACRGVLVNRTIDDKIGDLATGFVPIYQPQSLWAQYCSTCDSQPDIAKAFDGTFHWAVYETPVSSVNITLQFTGVAIWVFFLLTNYNTGSFAANTHVLITLDGQYAGFFSSDMAGPTIVTKDATWTYNVTIFSTSGLTNAAHELIIGTMSGYPNTSYMNFDWAIYTVDIDAPAPQSTSQSASSAATTYSSSIKSITSTSSPTSTTSSATPKPSSSKIGVIVGSTLGGLAVIALVLVFLIRRSRRALPIRYETEGTLDIDVPQQHHQASHHRHDAVPLHAPRRSKAARLREERQREINERIQSAQRELDNLWPDRNAGSASEIGNPSAASSSQPSPELALLRNEMQQLRDRVDYLQAQRESDWALGLSDQLPPSYTQL